MTPGWMCARCTPSGSRRWCCSTARCGYRWMLAYSQQTVQCTYTPPQKMMPRGGAREQRGATLAVLPDSRGRVDLAAMLHDLARRQVNELHVEAGQQLNGALLRQGLVDELLVYLAPKLIGPGLGMAQLAPLAALSQAQALDFHGLERVGEDVRILARWRDREPFWG